MSKPIIEDRIDELSSGDLDEVISEASKLESHAIDDNLNDFDRLAEETMKPELDIYEETLKSQVAQPKTINRQEMIDDYIRNFFIKHGLEKSLSVFQKEWYEVSQKGKIKVDETDKAPDIKIKNQQLSDKLSKLNSELDEAKKAAESAKATWDKLRKEKEYHLQHKIRVDKEKTRLFEDINKLKKLHTEYEEKYEQLKAKYEAAMKEKMLIKMERDRYQTSSRELNHTLKRLEDQDLSVDKERPAEKPKQDLKRDQNSTSKTVKTLKGGQATTFSTKKGQDDFGPGTKIPNEDISNPYLTQSFEPSPSKNVAPTRNLRAHNLAVTALAIHPRKPFIATGGADHTWKIWSVPGGEMIIEGSDHKDWISGLDFSPLGTNFATCSGDSTVKIWDFLKVGETFTFKCHSSPVYGVSYHHSGDFLVSGTLFSSRLYGSDRSAARYPEGESENDLQRPRRLCDSGKVSAFFELFRDCISRQDHFRLGYQNRALHPDSLRPHKLHQRFGR